MEDKIMDLEGRINGMATENGRLNDLNKDLMAKLNTLMMELQ